MCQEFAEEKKQPTINKKKASVKKQPLMNCLIEDDYSSFFKHYKQLGSERGFISAREEDRINNPDGSQGK